MMTYSAAMNHPYRSLEDLPYFVYGVFRVLTFCFCFNGSVRMKDILPSYDRQGNFSKEQSYSCEYIHIVPQKTALVNRPQTTVFWLDFGGKNNCLPCGKKMNTKIIHRIALFIPSFIPASLRILMNKSGKTLET
jgi:hypothetical protein